MSEKRRNLGILAVVFVLMAAAMATVVVRGFTLGLDLRGGLEVVLKARPIHGNTISAQTLSNAADVMRKRIDPRGILQPEIRTSTADNTIDISIPGVKNPNAVANLLVAGQLTSFNFYGALTPVSRVSATTGAAAAALRHADGRQEAAAVERDRRPGGRSSTQRRTTWCRATASRAGSSRASHRC